MARRVNLPAADDLFRPTGTGTGKATVRAVPDAPDEADLAPPPGAPAPTTKKPSRRSAPPVPGASGRIRHDEKMTVYVTADELMLIERSRLALRGEHGLGVDRGRLVREALHLVLEEFEARGEDSALVRRLRA